MLLTEGFERMIGQFSNNMIEELGIEKSIGKVADALNEIGNDFAKDYFRNSLSILNTKASLAKQFGEPIDIKKALTDVFKDSFGALLNSTSDDQLLYVARVLETHLG